MSYLIQTLIFNNIKEFFNRGHERSIKAKKNIVASFIIKGLNILTSLILVPITIDYLNPTKYGIWITLSSIIGWFSFFDIGLGNGLRNKFAEALAVGDNQLAKCYVSTTYAVLAIIIILALILFYFISPLINWAVVLNTNDYLNAQNELSLLALIVFSFFCLRFLFQLIAIVLIADQQPAKSSLINLYANVFTLFLVIILMKSTNGCLICIGTVYSGLPVIVFIVSSIWFYKGRYRQYRPSIRAIDFTKTKDLFSIGIKFFIIQIAGIALYETNNIIISQLFGPSEVTPYNIAFKYFSIILMIFAIIVTPFWSAFTDAWIKKEIDWIKLVMKNLLKIWGLLLLAVGIMLIISPWIYQLWIGSRIYIPFSLSLLVCCWVIINVWNGIFSNFLNGVGKIKLQLIFSVLAALANIPLAFYLGSRMGVPGVILANVLIASSVAFLGPLQYSKIIKMKASGIWNK